MLLKINLDKVIERYKSPWVTELIQHIGIYARSGAGKTNAVFVLISNFLHKNKPFPIFDWKRNYRDLLATSVKDKMKVYTVGKNVSPFYFNPLIPPPELIQHNGWD